MKLENAYSLRVFMFTQVDVTEEWSRRYSMITEESIEWVSEMTMM